MFKSLLLNDLGSTGNQCVYFYPLNIEHALKCAVPGWAVLKLLSLEKEGWPKAGVVVFLPIPNPQSHIPNFKLKRAALLRQPLLTLDLGLGTSL
jgi:hypothetical protein